MTISPSSSSEPIDFRTHPGQYRHWKLRIEPPLAYLSLDVDEQGALNGDYELKQNSYDLGVDIELYDATQRLRLEHPEVRAVVINSGKERIFCAGGKRWNRFELLRVANNYKALRTVDEGEKISH